MLKTRWIRFSTFPLAFALVSLSGCIFEWREDDDVRRRGRGGFHDGPMAEDCGPDRVWDPVACECVPRGPSGSGDAGSGSNEPDAGVVGAQCPDPMTARYLSEDFASCGQIQFNCPSEYQSFAIEGCGCGCVMGVPPDPCPPSDAEGLIMVSRETKVCETVEFTCPEGSQKFFADCGCGCIAAAQVPNCPDPNDPMVHYLGDDPSVCSLITFTCPDTCTPFNDDCGCGCIENP